MFTFYSQLDDLRVAVTVRARRSWCGRTAPQRPTVKSTALPGGGTASSCVLEEWAPGSDKYGSTTALTANTAKVLKFQTREWGVEK